MVPAADGQDAGPEPAGRAEDGSGNSGCGLLEGADGMAHGNDWACGFMRGMGIRHEGWAELVNDEERGGCLIPMMLLCHEHDEDPEMRPDPISTDKREEVIVHMAAGLVAAYRYFREHRRAHMGTS